MGLGPKTHSLGFRAETSGKLSDFAGAFGGSASFGRSAGLSFHRVQELLKPVKGLA